MFIYIFNRDQLSKVTKEYKESRKCFLLNPVSLPIGSTWNQFFKAFYQR